MKKENIVEFVKANGFSDPGGVAYHPQSQCKDDKQRSAIMLLIDNLGNLQVLLSNDDDSEQEFVSFDECPARMREALILECSECSILLQNEKNE